MIHSMHVPCDNTFQYNKKEQIYGNKDECFDSISGCNQPNLDCTISPIKYKQESKKCRKYGGWMTPCSDVIGQLRVEGRMSSSAIMWGCSACNIPHAAGCQLCFIVYMHINLFFLLTAFANFLFERLTDVAAVYAICLFQWIRIFTVRFQSFETQRGLSSAPNTFAMNPRLR